MSEDETCSVCYELFTLSVVLPCKHRFCMTCILRWYDQTQQCPTCRSEFVLPNIKRRNNYRTRNLYRRINDLEDEVEHLNQHMDVQDEIIHTADTIIKYMEHRLRGQPVMMSVVRASHNV